MSDLNDKTLEMAEKTIDAAVQERLAAMKQRQCDHPKFASWDGETCFDCTAEMPPVRIEMGRVRCVGCQEVAEKKGVV